MPTLRHKKKILNILTLCLKELEKKDETKPKFCSKMEIMRSEQ